MTRDRDRDPAMSDPQRLREEAAERGAGASRGMFGEKRIFIRTGESMRYARVSRRAQIAMALGCAAALGWTVFATASLGVLLAERDAQDARMASLRSGYETRIDTLERRGDALEKTLTEVRGRASDLSREVTSQQIRLLDAQETERELTISVQALRAKLRDAVIRRDAAQRAAQAMRTGLEEARRRMSRVETTEEDWTSAMASISDALDAAVTSRDEALSATQELSAELADLQDQIRRDREARDRLYAQLEDAVRVGLGSVEGALTRAGLNVDDLAERVRAEYSGEGGPFIPVSQTAGVEAAGADVARVAALITGLERLNLMQVAATRLPLATPVRSAFRFTSGFGVRRDPKNGRHRMHAGVDFAAGRGTPIYATGDGVVTFAGWQTGYGRVVKIQHAFGFETVYAHMNKIRIKKGERVARGDRIGDMGNSGRSTGVHLHYEVRNGGKPINPLRYIEAARNVL